MLIAAFAALWAFSRAAVLLIDRRWPPIGVLLRIGGIRLHLLDTAASAGAPVVVLIHGASGNLREPLGALQPALGGRYRLIAFDRPGHGHTSRGPRDMSDPARQADLFAQALRRAGVQSCIAVGHSWGAAVAAALAVHHPLLVAGLVLVAPATHPWPGGISRRTRFFALPYVGRALAELIVIPLGLKAVASALRSIFRPDPVPENYGRRIGALLAIRPRTFTANCRDIVDLYGHLVRLAGRYDQIRCPTEIVTGDTDPVVAPTIHSYGLARDIPGARLTVLRGAGHMPHWAHAAEIAAAIERVRDARPTALAAE